MASKSTKKPQTPGAKTPPAAKKGPPFDKFVGLVGAIAKQEFNVELTDQASFDALSDETRAKLLAYYDRFSKAPPDPTAEQLQEGADQVLDVKLAGASPIEGAVDPTAIERPVLTKDGWVVPVPKPKA